MNSETEARYEGHSTRLATARSGHHLKKMGQAD